MSRKTKFSYNEKELSVPQIFGEPGVFNAKKGPNSTTFDDNSR